MWRTKGWSVPNGQGKYYSRDATVVLVALGSNRGDSAALVMDAIEQLRRFAASDFNASSLWRTGPVDCPPGADDFVNAVVSFTPLPQLTPELLLKELKLLEGAFGRADVHERNAPREMDLDLLCFGSARRASDVFTLPHPRAHLRRFVLTPAAEVAPHLVWPGTGRTVAQLLDALPNTERVAQLP